MKLFYPDFVAIIRKKGDSYIQEVITASAILSGAKTSPETIRQNVINRLRGDKSVFLVFEGKNGECKEEAMLPEGFLFSVQAHEGEPPNGELSVFYKDYLAYKEEFVEDPEDDENIVTILASSVTDLLNRIGEGDYSFLGDDCPYFTRVEPEAPVSLYDAERLLEQSGYQCEKIHALGYPGPCLFVNENEVFLLGSRCFDGESLFLEMKRIFFGIKTKKAEETIERVGKNFNDIEVVHWEDGSWSFRLEFDENLCKGNFKEKLQVGISYLQRMLTNLEEQEGLGPEPWRITSEQRDLFIYETVDAALTYSKIKI